MRIDKAIILYDDPHTLTVREWSGETSNACTACVQLSIEKMSLALTHEEARELGRFLLACGQEPEDADE